MTAPSPDPPQPARALEPCSHPWLLVRCGECGAALDELRADVSAPAGEAADGAVAQAEPPSAPDAQALFIVARGHPELVEQVQALLGDSGSVRVIEDRRRTTRDPASPEGHDASALRGEFRRRIADRDSNEAR